MKRPHCEGINEAARSPPTRRRGLKPYCGMEQGGCAGVASHAEAWIETPCADSATLAAVVASHAEAWIETVVLNREGAALGTSPPTRRRGLKLSWLREHGAAEEVASHAEAWIETRCWTPCAWPAASPPTRRRGLKPAPLTLSDCPAKSPPTRRRGLKQCGAHGGCCACASPPTRRRGLKRVNDSFQFGPFGVASHAEAWIETGHCAELLYTGIIASHAEAWIETDHQL